MVNKRYYGNKKGATIPFMTRLSIETYQTIAEISEKVDIGLNQIGVALIEYALTHAELEECVGHRLRFKIPTISEGKLANKPQEGASNE
jgi:hypothetical protein